MASLYSNGGISIKGEEGFVCVFLLKGQKTPGLPPHTFSATFVRVSPSLPCYHDRICQESQDGGLNEEIHGLEKKVGLVFLRIIRKNKQSMELKPYPLSI